jgi:phage gp46-like protein
VNGGTDLPSFTIPDSNDFLPEDGLNTAVLLSLFTNRRALPGDVLPVAGMDQQGWWGDTQSPLLNEQIGSRLWLLARSKTTPEVLTKAEDIAREALQWLIDDKVASTVDVTAAQGGTSLIPVLALTVAIHKPEGTAATFKYNLQWTAQKGEG